MMGSINDCICLYYTSTLMGSINDCSFTCADHCIMGSRGHSVVPIIDDALQAWVKQADANKREVRGLKPNVSRFAGLWRLQVGPYDTRDAALEGCKKLEIGKNGCFAIDIGD